MATAGAAGGQDGGSIGDKDRSIQTNSGDGAVSPRLLKFQTASSLRDLPLKDYPAKEFWSVVLGTALLSVVGGYVNGACFAGVWFTGLTHLTGTTTLAGVRIVFPPPEDTPYKWTAGALWCFILAYTIGSAVGGAVLGDNRIKWKGRQGTVLVASGVSMIIAWVIASSDDFAVASGPVGAWFILVSMGLQNSITSVFGGLTIRTANVTGTVCDIGIAIGQVLASRSREHLWKLEVWTPAFFGFWLGALIGAASFDVMGVDSLLLPGIAHFGLAALTFCWVAKVRSEAKAGKADEVTVENPMAD